MKLAARQQLVQQTIDQLRDQVARITEQLNQAERALERLQITSVTVQEPAAEEGPPTVDTLPPGDHDILAVIEHATDGLRPKQLCQILGIGTGPRHVEGIRAKLRRLVSRGLLTEPKPGLFTQADST
ncbi:hypothetical protein AAW14_23945 [Streptomyces hygroscopicus]|nr:hypothetical protein [Streptomyces hygroscopicus]